MAQPQLGYGQKSEFAIDQVNQWMRQTPWYQQQMQAWGKDPGHPTLTKSQSQQILKLAQGQGVVVDEGDMEIDDHGNFNPKGHKLRNTLIVGGIAAATLLTAGAAGAFSGAALGPSTAANMAATSAAVGGASVPAGIAAGTTGLSMAGLSYADLLKYAVPQGMDLVNGIFQRKDANKQFDASQAYLEQALAYQKEQDAFNRQRQTGLDQQERDRYAYTTGQDAARYGDTQAMWGYNADESANRYGYEADREVSRYGDYSKRIAPYLASGASANDRMTSLLGLPAGAPFDPTLTPGPVRKVIPRPTLSAPGTGFGGPSANQRVATDPATDAAIRAALQAANSSDDFGYWQDKLAAHGDSSTKNWQYWQDFINRGDGVGKGYRG